MINLSAMSVDFSFSNDYSAVNNAAAIAWFKANNIGMMNIAWHIEIDPKTGVIMPTGGNQDFPGKQWLTTSLADVAAFAQQATAAGLQVTFKPYFENATLGYNIATDVGGNSENLPAITATMGTYLTQVATMARSVHAAAIVLGTENSAIQRSDYLPFWRSTIAAVRANYTGLLGYAATYFPFKAANETADVRDVAFASLLDFIGADLYLPVASQSAGAATYDQAVAAWTHQQKAWWPDILVGPNTPATLDIVASLKAISDMYGKPLVLTETAYPASTWASWNPARTGGTPDGAEQAILTKAEFDVLKTAGSWFAGALWFGGGARTYGPTYSASGSITTDLAGQPATKALADYIDSVGNFYPTTQVKNEMGAVLRSSTGSFATTLLAQVDSHQATADSALTQIVQQARASSSVATLAYEYFTGKVPSAAGMDYLVSPTGPNTNNINGSYYQSFSLENRYINFAVNLGKVGEGAAAFTAAEGAKTLFEATRDAYSKIFGAAPTDAKLHALLDPSFVLNGVTMTRAEYFAYYGQDGANGIGTKAAMVGWLLAEAAKADVGSYAKSNDAFLIDVGLHNAPFAVDIIGVYGKPDYVFSG